MSEVSTSSQADFDRERLWNHALEVGDDEYAAELLRSRNSTAHPIKKSPEDTTVERFVTTIAIFGPGAAERTENGILYDM